MCGIWLFLSPKDIPASSYRTYFDHATYLERRGPDKTNVMMHPHYLMVFHRLAFHDLSPLGDQPFHFSDQSKHVYLMVNGEIYNYQQLIEKHQFVVRSNNDCEIIYHLYQKYHGNMDLVCQELDGEFVFVLLEIDGPSITCKAARDPFGVRPLFYYFKKDHGIFMSSLAQCIPTDTMDEIHVFPPGTTMEIDNTWNLQFQSYYHYPSPTLAIISRDNLRRAICQVLIAATEKRLQSERPIACLLSGGLDSSLICAITSRILNVSRLHTFSIGMEGSSDLKYAQEVSQHLGTIHHEIQFTKEEGFQVIEKVIRACETWDITTIRASVGQYLLAKYISEHTEVKAILNGDGADEVEMGYLYWYQSPSPMEAHNESIRRLQEIHVFDGLRVDRCLGHFGLEARIPYLDKDFVNFFLQLPIECRQPIFGVQCEKHIIREAFHHLYPDILPSSVLWRTKEAFSDGVSSQGSSWFQQVQDYMNGIISDDEFEHNRYHLGLPEVPLTKEAYMYQKTFCQLFGPQRGHRLIPHYWLPKWQKGVTDPSARVLSVYDHRVIPSTI